MSNNKVEIDQLVPGKKYQVLNTKFSGSDEGSYISGNCRLEYVQCAPCFDARSHGAGNPADYVSYIFKLPGQLGTVSFYRFQITAVIEN